MSFGSYGRISIYRFNNVSECNDLGFPLCDNSTCFESNLSSFRFLICTSFCPFDLAYCQSNATFRCADNNLIFLDHFCDGTIDCIDGSDEIRNGPGFKCNECVLPQINLQDNSAQCLDGLDLCQGNNSCVECQDKSLVISYKQICDGVSDCDDMSDECVLGECSAKNQSCFLCLDNRKFVSTRQVCDGISDCFDESDECLCDENIHAKECATLHSEQFSCFEHELLNIFHSSLKIFARSAQSNNNTITCQTKYGSTEANFCDGKPECKDFSDECLCSYPPSFCYDPCRFFFNLGDRYCDGVEDQAWKFIKNDSCPQGFDEKWCPKRFKCNSTDGKVSVDISKVCDGKLDCNDASDESSCTNQQDENRFSSETEMIDNAALRYAFWLMGALVLLGNAFVIVRTILYLKKKKVLDVAGFQYVIILNISIADFIMGAYLLTIAAYSAKFSGIYGLIDLEWKSSSKCSIIGSLAVISSEASCFLMMVLTAFRLWNIYHPIKSLASPLRPWIVCVFFSWALSLAIGLTPILQVFSQYFVHSVSFSSRFHQTKTINSASMGVFICRYAAFSNITIPNYGNVQDTIVMFLNNLPDSAPVYMYGYYGENSVCMPRFYVTYGDQSWEYTVSIITLNFLCFLFIAACYIFIVKHSFNSSAKLGNKRRPEQSKKMQKRVARIIATDFCCWIPICIMAYVRLGVKFSTVAYEISAVLLLPINSLLNPFLFSPLPDKLLDWFYTKWNYRQCY